MLRLKRVDLDRACEMIAVCALNAVDAHGLKIAWRLEPKAVEKAVCAMLSGLTPAPYVDAVLPEDVTMTGLADFPDHIFATAKAARETGPEHSY